MGDLKKTNKYADKVEKIEEFEKENPSKNVVSNIAGTDKKSKMISASVNIDNYAAFTKINKSKGMSNNSVLNMLISNYIKEEKSE